MKQKVALVLSGGGARGMAHIGVIEELEKQGYEITSIAGTSMGSQVIPSKLMTFIWQRRWWKWGSMLHLSSSFGVS